MKDRVLVKAPSDSASAMFALKRRQFEEFLVRLGLYLHLLLALPMSRSFEPLIFIDMRTKRVGADDGLHHVGVTMILSLRNEACKRGEVFDHLCSSRRPKNEECGTSFQRCS